MWSHVELFAGVRFHAVNDLLHAAARQAGWPNEKSAMFRMELIGMFFEKVGDFCASEEDIGEFCPVGSTAITVSGLAARVLQETDRLGAISTVAEAARYARERSLLEPLGAYMLPAAAQLSGDREIWDWSRQHFGSSMPGEDRTRYVEILRALESRGPEAA